jgi:hypothetical protein
VKLHRRISQNVFLAAFYGGAVEVVWIGAYCALTGHSGAAVARHVTSTLFPAVSSGTPGVVLGIGLHFALSLLVALAYVRVIWTPYARRWSDGAALAAALAVLALVWALNFLLVLPLANPVFVALLPYPVSLASKLLFGAAMAGALRDGVRHRLKRDRALGLPAAAA